MELFNPFKISQSCRNKFCSNIIDSSAPRVDFYFLVGLSTLIVALGLLADNVILVIGGMMVTPLLSPLLAVALGIVINDHKVIIRSVKIFLSSFSFALIIAFIVGIFSFEDLSDVKLITIMRPSLFTLLVAFVAGIAASYTWVKPELDVHMAGIAVTVTLIPPLTAIGLSLATGEWFIFRDVFSVFCLNIFGIVVASLTIFSLMDFYKSKKKIIEEVKEEEKEIKKIKQEAQKKAEAAKKTEETKK